MKQLYLNLGMGAAGDMLAAALYELLDDEEKQEFIEKMNALGLDGVSVYAEPSVKCGITGTHMRVCVHGEEESSHDHDHHHDHDHDHDHDHGHDHHHDHDHDHHHDRDHDHHHDHDHDHDHDHHHHHDHRALKDIAHIVEHMPLSESCRASIMKVYSLIAEAESRAHGKPVELVHFHEVGALDAVADIAAVCLLVEMLAPDRITASPVRVGCGSVRCAHGVLPVPAPATAHILTGIPSYAGDIKAELCTPTGAALVRCFAKAFEQQPLMAVERIGYGMGRKDFTEANCLRAVLGEIEAKTPGLDEIEVRQTEIVELCFNVDDMTGEEIGFALERFFEHGARDAYTLAIGMKKSRPGTMICVLADEAHRQELIREIFKHTTTLGVRERGSTRYELPRSVETLDTAAGSVRVKSSSGFGVDRAKLEYDDLASIAREKGISLYEARALVAKSQENGASR